MFQQEFDFKTKYGLDLSDDQVMQLKKIFAIANLDHSGVIGRRQFSDLMFLLGIEPTHDELDAMLLEMDENGDGQIEFEEFVVAMPEADGDTAWKTAERIRQTIEDHRFAHEDSQPNCTLTISGGVASFPVDGAMATELLNHADQALYRACGRCKLWQLYTQQCSSIQRAPFILARTSQKGQIPECSCVYSALRI